MKNIVKISFIYVIFVFDLFLYFKSQLCFNEQNDNKSQERRHNRKELIQFSIKTML